MAEMVGRKHYFRELAPWIQEQINLFKEKNDIELHVVAPNYASNKDVLAFRDNIHYHYYHYSPTWLSIILMPLFRTVYKQDEPYKMAERVANMLTNYRTAERGGARIVESINPDLIHLGGSENPDYSYSAVKLLYKYPMLLSIQGYACRQEKGTNIFDNWFQTFRIKPEKEINKEIRFVASTSPKTTKETIRGNEMGFFSKCEEVYYCRAITKVPQVDALTMEKQFDVAFYARIMPSKGIEDLINVLELLKKKGRVIKAVIMGRGDEQYIVGLKEDIRKRGLENQIVFIGFVENHEEVYKIASQARLLVLPTHRDGLPNTVREAMFMRLPVVANNVGGIPRFNENRHCIHLVELGDIDGLADGICKVLDDDNYCNELIENSYKEAYEVYSPSVVYDQLLSAYNDIFSRSLKSY